MVHEVFGLVSYNDPLRSAVILPPDQLFVCCHPLVVKTKHYDHFDADCFKVGKTTT